MFSHIIVFNGVEVNKILLGDVSIVIGVDLIELIPELSLLDLGNLINIAAIRPSVGKQDLLEGDSAIIVVIVLLPETVPLLLGLLLCSVEIRSLVNNCLLGGLNLSSRSSCCWGLRRSHW